MSRRSAVVGLSFVSFLCVASFVARGDEKPPTAAKPDAAAADGPEFTVGELRVQTFPAITHLHQTAEVTQAEVVPTLDKALAACFKARDERKVWFTGPVFYVNRVPDLDLKRDTQPGDEALRAKRKFIFEPGVVVPENTVAPAGLTVTKRPAFKCVTVLYTGPTARMGEGYKALFEAAAKAGHVATGEIRQMDLYWEGQESRNNVFQFQLGIK